MSCKNQKFNHSFIGSGENAYCLECNVNQFELSYGKKEESPIKFNIRQPSKNLHSETHDIANQLYTHFGKKEKFGLFLGLIKNRGKAWAFQKLSEIKDYEARNKKAYPVQFLMKADNPLDRVS